TALVALGWANESREFAALAGALQTEIPKLTQHATVVCWECSFNMLTPVNLLDHLMEHNHLRFMGGPCMFDIMIRLCRGTEDWSLTQ
ncbi:hypothetical protein PFISCL1PPCAC_25806, partial [Pristionchus fissidentatus]